MVRTRKYLIPIVNDAGRIVGDLPTEMSVRCAVCRHWTIGVCCKAFPDGIPNEIRSGKFDHKQPFPGDNGVRFERIMRHGR